MSSQSNNQGRAYEYIFLLTLHLEINKIRKSEIVKNSAYFATKKAWEFMDEYFQNYATQSAKAAIDTLFDIEPMILEKNNDILTLKIQTDTKGKEGDVRDILISRKDIQWEIGLSLKHNHFAVKHSRLGKSLDFGKRWFNVPCSRKYWEEIEPIFAYLEKQKSQHKKWSEIELKEDRVYVPLLKAFMRELKASMSEDNKVPRKMVEYLLGEFDFYKIISITSKRITQIQSYNMHGQLNQSSKLVAPKITIPLVSLPTRIVSIEFKPNSKNTIELYMNGGWQFNFRIHNASTKVETSLKFDIQIIGMPTTIISISCSWK